MRQYIFEKLNRSEIASLLQRPSDDFREVIDAVRDIVDNIRASGDEALAMYSKKLDRVELQRFKVAEQEFDEAEHLVSAEVKEALAAAAWNIEIFHRRQIPKAFEVETTRGVLCRLEWKPVRRVGLYIPGGSAPLVSTVLMLGIPARLSNCPEVVLCTPPTKSGSVAPEILHAATLCGIKTIFKVGGAQAIAAMGLGTETIPKVDKIFGPGNRFVVAAKAMLSQPPYTVAIDMLAGPSELVVVADETANPRWVAADLLSQAEHGADSQVVLVTTSAYVAENIQRELARQSDELPRSAVASQALKNSFVVLTSSLTSAMEFVNLYAPEHLILAVRDAEQLASEVSNAGSVFVGHMSSVVFGDYASGTNHTLPTGGTAAAVGALTVQSFMKPVAFQAIAKEGLRSLRNVVKSLARTEGLEAHRRAVEIREESL